MSYSVVVSVVPFPLCVNFNNPRTIKLIMGSAGVSTKAAAVTTCTSFLEDQEGYITDKDLLEGAPIERWVPCEDMETTGRFFTGNYPGAINGESLQLPIEVTHLEVMSQMCFSLGSLHVMARIRKRLENWPLHLKSNIIANKGFRYRMQDRNL